MKPVIAVPQQLPDSDPRKFIVAGLVVIAAFFGGLGLWAAFFPFAGAVIAPGMVKVSQERKVIQHLEGGIVEEILVREGSKVAAGDLLIRLQSAAVAASADLVQSQVWAKQALAARLRAESQLGAAISWPEELLANRELPDVREAMTKEEDVFRSGRTDLEGKLALHASQIRQLEERIAGAEEEMKAVASVIAALREELQAKEALLEGRYIDLSQVLQLRRELADSEGKRGSLHQSIAGMRQQIEELKLRSVDLRNTYREKAATDLSTAADDVIALRERLRPAIDSRQRLEIRAPIAGEVIGLKVHSVGGVVRPGEPIMEIVPSNSDLIVESKIRPEDITRVHPGQHTRVQLTAFDRREVSPLSGEVIHVSADMLSEPAAAGGSHAYYQVNVRVPPEELTKQKVYLSPGMPAVCFIETEERTILGYLLEPIFFFLDRSLREA